MTPYVVLENVAKTYDTEGVKVNALHDVSFTIVLGEVCVIVGQSGAGKTTLLNILGGMDTLTSGKVFLGEDEISAYNKRQLTRYRREDVGFVFQFYNLIPNLTALENVEMATELSKAPFSAKQVLEDVGKLSGAAQRRRAAARRHCARAGKEPEAPALRRADRRAGRHHGQAGIEDFAGLKPRKGHDRRHHHTQQRVDRDGRPRGKGKERNRILRSHQRNGKAD